MLTSTLIVGELTPLLDGRGDGQTTLLGGLDGGHTTVKHVLQLLLKHSLIICLYISDLTIPGLNS